MSARSVSLEEATKVIAATLQHGRSIACAPLTVAVLDPGGHLVALQREDRSGIMRVEIAVGKAWGALGMRLPSRELASRAESMPQFINALTVASQGRLIPVPGGVLIRDEEDVVGAVGVSGDLSDRDEECAVQGVEAAGLTPDMTSTAPH